MSDFPSVEYLIKNKLMLSDGDLYSNCNDLPEMMNEYRKIVRKHFDLEMPEDCYLDELVSLLAWKLTERIKERIVAKTDIKTEDIEWIIDDVQFGGFKNENLQEQ